MNVNCEGKDWISIVIGNNGDIIGGVEVNDLCPSISWLEKSLQKETVIIEGRSERETWQLNPIRDIHFPAPLPKQWRLLFFNYFDGAKKRATNTLHYICHANCVYRKHNEMIETCPIVCVKLTCLFSLFLFLFVAPIFVISITRHTHFKQTEELYSQLIEGKYNRRRERRERNPFDLSISGEIVIITSKSSFKTRRRRHCRQFVSQVYHYSFN